MNYLRHVCGTKLLKAATISRLPRRQGSNEKIYDLINTMPRDTRRTVNLATQRLKMKEKSMKYTPGTINLQVLGSGAKGAPTSLYMFTDQSRYLFNCGEGAQRLAHEHKIKLSRLEHIFITYGCWNKIGGLPGVALTLQDVGVPQITLHGPSNTGDIFPATRRFIILKHLSINMASCTPKDVYEDNAIKVNYIPLVAPCVKRPTSATCSQKDNIEDDTDYYEHEKKSRKAKKRRSSSAEPVPKKISGEDVSMCYAVKLHPKQGALNLTKCVEANVPSGPLLGQLKAGEDIVLEDGTVVRSVDVTSPDDPGPLILVVDVPDEKFLHSFENSFKRYQLAENEDDSPYVIVHFTPPHIMAHDIYKKWMNKFRMSVQHLLINAANKCLGSTAVHRIQYKLNSVEPNIFPLLNDPGFQLENQEKLKENIPNGVSENSLSSECLVINGNTKSKISLRPKQVFVNESLQIDPDCYLAEVEKSDGYSETILNLRSQWNNISPKEPEEYPNVVFLGTGSCIPNKTRNTSSILLNISDDCRMVMDCGEGTAGQIIRHYGYKEASNVFANIRAIYVSHLHADHHIGLIGLLQNRPSSLPPLYLLAPSQIMTWLRFYDEFFENILQTFTLIPNADIRFNEYHLKGNLKNDLNSALNMAKVETTFVRHCPNAFGVSFTSNNGWKVTYSGDTMPSEDLIELGADSDLLIHEATMEDELSQEARLKLHCTTSEAIEVGKKMRAKNVILTHFSQRYAKLPRIIGENFGDNIGVAFDNMKVRFDDLPKLKLLYPALKLIFRDDVEELEEKAYKRQLKIERAKR